MIYGSNLNIAPKMSRGVLKGDAVVTEQLLMICNEEGALCTLDSVQGTIKCP